MERKMVVGNPIERWIKDYPLLRKVMAGKEVFWTNPRYASFESAQREMPLTAEDIRDAEDRLNRFAPYIARVFPDTRPAGGIIESPLIRIPAMQKALASAFGNPLSGTLLLKCDSHLPVSGSIKARGGIYEVLVHAERLAVEKGRLSPDEDYSKLDDGRFRDFFSDYAVSVGSTGNLGLSIGIIATQLGFDVTVHMSSDARSWKKDLLRKRGARVVEYASDYSRAVAAGRQEAALNPNTHFVDDENSTDLFLGYAVAATRLKQQLADMEIPVDHAHPLFVYLPCGVGGGPGGITFGLKQTFGDHVHCVFAEPTASPCMLLGLMTRLHERVNVRDFGLDNVTDADGLAVASPSGFVGKTLERAIFGVYTVKDTRLYEMLRMMRDVESIFLEPSALAGLPGPFRLSRALASGQGAGKQEPRLPASGATHIVWATGGSMVPEEIMAAYYNSSVS